MFMDFLKSLSLFGRDAPAERIQELVEIIEGQADLDAQFNVSDLVPFLCWEATLVLYGCYVIGVKQLSLPWLCLGDHCFD